jgi:tetratricopeptide (TPR) repeat protein
VKLGDLALAITEFEQYLALVPNHVAIREELAGVYTQAEKFAAAAAAYQELIRLAPANTSRYLVALSDLLVRMKDYHGAIEALRRAIERIDPKVQGAGALRADAAARLARTHLFDEDLPASFEVIQKYLAALKPGDEDVPIRYISLLLDLERAKDAQPFLAPFLATLGDNPDPEILVNNVRLLALMNDKRKAMDAIELLGTKLPKNVVARLQLAENLITQEDYELAAVVFGQIAQIQQGHVPSQIAQARILIRQFRLTQVKSLLEMIKPATLEHILDVSLVRGQYHTAAGQYTEAKYLYLDILHQYPADPDARIGLAATYEVARDLEKAKAEYSKVPAQSRGWRRARRGLATVLAAQRRLPQAIEVLTSLQREAPWDHQTVLVFAQIADRNGAASQGAEVAGAYLIAGSPTPSSAAAVEGALGLCLLTMNKVAEAEAAFRSALAVSYNKSLVGQYGLIRVSQRLGGGPSDMGCPPEFAGDEIRYRLVLSDLCVDDRDDRRAFDHAFAAMRADPQNLAALIRVADIQQRLARETGVIDDAVATAKTVLVVSPTNVRGHLALARSLAIGRNYKGSTEVYQKLISLDADYTLPKRELARIYYADHRYNLSHDTYVSIAAGDPETALRAALQTISERAPAAAPAIHLLAGQHGQLPGLGPDLARLVTAQTDPVVGQAILSALADYEARADEVKGARLEDMAKSQKDLLNRSAIGSYRALIEQEPGNTDALFDLGQVYTTLQKTQEADRIYSELLAADPLSREGLISLTRNQAEMAPTYQSSFVYENESGRNGLANMDRFRLNQLITLPLGDKNELVGIGYSRVSYQPLNAADLNGNIVSVLFQKNLPGYDQLLFRSLINFEQYEDRFKNRPTGEVGLVDTGDGYFVTAYGYLENVVANAESLRQDIYRYGGRLTGEYQVDRRIDVGGLYRYAYYSDVNNLQEFDLHASYRFIPLPTQLRLIVTVDGLFYAKQSVFSPGAPDDLVGTIHPYFAPSSFTYYEAKLEFTHILGRDLFGGANNFRYIAQYGLGCDNQFNSYNKFRLDLNWDAKSWLSLGLAGQYTYSSVYKFGSIFGYVTVRLPHLYHL